MLRFRNFPELIEIEKAAEVYEFDGKELQFGERAMRISKRVF